ncbi:MAG: zinc-binding dehydrogenase [Fimbriimonadaceae bacterium]
MAGHLSLPVGDKGKVLPATMSALVLIEPGRAEIRDVEVETPGPGELLIEVLAANTCGTDLKAFRRGHPQFPTPCRFGHEYSGKVAAAGAGAKFEVGDEVMGVHSAPCGECRLCTRGKENLCETVMSTKVMGSYARYLLVPDRIASRHVFGKPAHLSHAAAACLEPLACVAHGLDAAQPRADDRVLVIGPGAVGLLFVAALRVSGVRNVTLAGRNPARLAVGTQQGASAVQWPPNGEFDVVVECTGSVEVWEVAHSLVAPGGTLVLFGGCPAGSLVQFDTGRLHYAETRVLSPFHFTTRDVVQARDWLVEGGIDPSPILAGERPLSDAVEVFSDLASGKGIKYTLVP